jgi:hypothetical protein
MKKHVALVAIITIITIPIHLFSALQDLNLDKKFPTKTITLSLKPTKTTWEKVKENKVRTAAGGFTTMVTALGAAEIIQIAFDSNTPNKEKARAALGTVIFTYLSYCLLKPIFNDETSDTPQEQNNNQH